jgi:hypothetical protein
MAISVTSSHQGGQLKTERSQALCELYKQRVVAEKESKYKMYRQTTISINNTPIGANNFTTSGVSKNLKSMSPDDIRFMKASLEA